MTRVVVAGAGRAALASSLCAAGVDAVAIESPSDADLAGVDCLVGFRWPAGCSVAVPWIHVTGLGLDGFAAAPLPALMTRTVGTMPEQMGRYVLAAVASWAERHHELAAAQAAGEWLDVGARVWPTRALVLGTGLAASGVARALRGLGMSVAGVNRSGRAAPDFDRVVGWDDLDSVLDPAPEVVVNLLPGAASTESVVGDSLFSRLSGALFVNPGRGSTVDDGALLGALDAGRVDTAWLDVFRTEPLPRDHWAWSHPGVRLTPHMAAVTTDADVVADLLAALDALARGATPPTAVTPPTP